MSVLEPFKRLFTRTSAKAAGRRVPAEPTEHPILGNLVLNKTFPESLMGRVKCGTKYIDLQVSPDDATIEVALELAVAMAGALPQLDAKCRKLLANEFLESYNTNWRFGQTALQDGSFKSFEKPVLATEQFCTALNLESIEASGASMLVFRYGDGDMFLAHGLEVTAFDGTTFGDTHALMAG